MVNRNVTNEKEHFMKTKSLYFALALFVVLGIGKACAGDYTYTPNPGGNSGTIHGPNGQRTTVTRNASGNPTFHGSNGQSSTYMPNQSGGGTLFNSNGTRTMITPNQSGGFNTHSSAGSRGTYTPNQSGGGTFWNW